VLFQHILVVVVVVPINHKELGGQEELVGLPT
jgi:hypothetical protein